MNEESVFIHDLLTPLTVAHTHVRLLRTPTKGSVQAPLDPALQARLDKAFEALERLMTLVVDRRNVLVERADSDS